MCSSILKHKFVIYSFAFLASICLTAITIYHYPVFNIDGMLYLRVADVYLQEGLWAASKLYGWPFYSVLIALVSKFTSLSLLKAAYLLNFIFFSAIVLIFIKLIEEINDSYHILWLAVLVVLVFHPLNAYRADIIRGSGYWVFYLLSLWCLFRFSKTLSFRDAVCWSLSATIGMLFRVEGAAILILAPFIVWFFTHKTYRQRCLAFFKLNCLLLIYLLMLLVLCAYVILHGKDITDYLGRLPELIGRLSGALETVIYKFGDKIASIKKYVLVPTSANSAKYLWISGLIGTYIIYVIEVCSIAYVMVFYYMLGEKRDFATLTLKQILWCYFIINVITTFAFFQTDLYMSDRYLIPLAFVVLCYVPFGIYELYVRFKKRLTIFSLHGVFFFVICVLMLIMAAGSLHRFGPSKIHIYQAGKWLNAHTNKKARIYTNYSRFMFLADRNVYGCDKTEKEYFTFDDINKKAWVGYDYLVLQVDREHSDELSRITQIIHSQPTKVFSNKKENDKVVIFKMLVDD